MHQANGVIIFLLPLNSHTTKKARDHCSFSTTPYGKTQEIQRA